MQFTHFKINTGYSLTQGIVDVKDLIKKAKKLGFKSLAISDINNLFQAINFYEECIKNDIKPIIGATLYYADDHEPNIIYEMQVYVKNQIGYRNLNKLLTKMYSENNDGSKTAFLKSWLTKENTNGLIAFSGARNGSIGKYLLDDKIDLAKQEADYFLNIFGDNFFIELQRDAKEKENEYIEKAVNLCVEKNIAPVATNYVLFLEKDEYLVHELKSCIPRQETLYDLNRELKYNKEMYFKSQEEMYELFSDIPQAIENTQKISNMCNLTIKLGHSALPKYPTEKGVNEEQELRKQAFDGLNERLNKLYPDNEIRKTKEKEYTDRLNMELSVIEKMGFAGYFLVVSDFIKYSKNNDVPVGPGRGSGAGSLVAYSMKITDLDPLKYNLLFERFLNPERISMPDFDIDFCPDGRGKVINYVKNKYGHDKVSQISTFGTLAARAAVKDATKVLNFSYGLGDNISKMIRIPPAKAHEIDLKTFIFGNEEKGIPSDEKLLDLYNNDKSAKTVIDYALKLEGLPRQVGMHAGGVLISPEPITNFTPLYQKDKDTDVVSQYDKDSVEKAGLVKFDFLGLGNLTIISNTVKDINKDKIKNNEELLNIDDIDLFDDAIYKSIFASGNTSGIFQFESPGMKSLFRKVQPDKFEDLIALNALYRPGPMDIIPDWIEAKNMNEEERPYPHPMLKEVLKETYGFMVYQEQVMQAAQIIAGYSLGGADILRRAMGKKKPEEMAKQREVFISGAAKNNIDSEKANEIFDTIEKFSGYGFNKSHAAAYSWIAYQTAYLKYYYTQYFIKSQLNASSGDTDKLASILKDAKDNDLKILPPDINKSFQNFEVEGKDIRYALTALKGVGDDVAKVIVEVRKEGGDFKDIFDFLERMPSGKINKRALEPMILAGLFDNLHPNRNQLYDGIKNESLLKYHKKYHEKIAKEKDSQLIEIPLYRLEKGVKIKKKIELIKPELNMVDDFSEKDKSVYEKNSFGFYFNSDPCAPYLKELSGFKAAMSAKELINEYEENQINKGLICGVISSINPYKSKKGAHVIIVNGAETVQLMVKNETINKNKDLFKPDNFLAVDVGIFESDSEEKDFKFSVKEAYTFEQIFSLTAEKIFVGCDNDIKNIEKFNEICIKYPGKKEIKLCTEREPGGRRDKIISVMNVNFSSELLKELKIAFNEKWVKAVFNDKLDKPETNNTKKYKKFY